MACVAVKLPEEIQLYEPCPEDAYSCEFDVKPGTHAVVTAFELPLGWCLCFEAIKYKCHCSSWKDFYPVCDAEGCELVLERYKQICLPPGKYHAVVKDEFGQPVTPEPGEIQICASFAAGPC